jgi:hypothetical protein
MCARLAVFSWTRIRNERLPELTGVCLFKLLIATEDTSTAEALVHEKRFLCVIFFIAIQKLYKNSNALL